MLKGKVRSVNWLLLYQLWIKRPNYLFQGIEKKTAKLQGCEKGVVARHEAGHAVVGTSVANLLPGQPRVQVDHARCSVLDFMAI